MSVSNSDDSKKESPSNDVGFHKGDGHLGKKSSEYLSDPPEYLDVANLDLWNVAGNLSRPIASFWYQFVLLLIVAVPAILMYSWIMPNFILPFPTALGFKTLTVTYFGLFFSIMDVATGPACERFVAQYAEIDPPKALKYAQFFIYFQMFTGLAQVTVVAWFCLTYIVQTELAYAMWFFMIYSLTQFPGMLGVYQNILKGYQRFDKANIVDIIQGVLFENFTQIIFILIGRWWGMANPAIGELMGATIGYIIGKYLDDFIAMGLSAFFVSKIFKKYDVKLRQVLIPAFGWQEAKESLLYGFKLLGSTLISTLTDFLTLIAMISWLPNYVSIIGYIEIAKTVAGFVGTKYNFTALVSESFNNGKKKLTEYVVTSYWKHWWYLAFFLTLEICIIVPPILTTFGGEWGRAAWIIPIYVFPRLLVMPASMGAEILQGCDKPWYRTVGIISEKITKMLTVYLFLSPWGLPSILGQGSLIVLYVLHDIPAYIVITIVEFWYVHKTCVPVKVNMWQTFGAGTLCSIPIIPIDYLAVYIFNYVTSHTDSIVYPLITAGLLLIILLFIFPMIIFFFYGLFGGWDEIGIREFRDAVPLSGPSQFIVKIFYRCTAFGHKHSMLKNRFPNKTADAYREIRELDALQSQVVEANIEKK
jgi:O-antigen/teichoic acid export membrane protein